MCLSNRGFYFFSLLLLMYVLKKRRHSLLFLLMALSQFHTCAYVGSWSTKVPRLGFCTCDSENNMTTRKMSELKKMYDLGKKNDHLLTVTDWISPCVYGPDRCIRFPPFSLCPITVMKKTQREHKTLFRGTVSPVALQQAPNKKRSCKSFLIFRSSGLGNTASFGGCQSSLHIFS